MLSFLSCLSKKINSIDNSMKSNTIIFCQAPADVPYVLSLYEQKIKPISIYVINVEGVFKFLKSLNLDLDELTFIPYRDINLKNIRDVHSEKIRINNLFKKYFLNCEYAQVYFFSRFEDWLTAAFINKLSKIKGVVINYLNHYDDTSAFDVKNKPRFRIRIYYFLLKYITEINFVVKIQEKLPEFPVHKYNIVQKPAIVSNDIFNKYAYTDKMIERHKPNALFFISDYQDSIFAHDSYYETIINIISILHKSNYCVILKGHPRIGLPNAFRKAADAEIPSYVPGEFINMRDIKICIGLDTGAITYFARNQILPTYSLIRMAPAVNDRQIEILVDYLKKLSANKLQFIDDKVHLTEMLKNQLHAK